ncbi:MAG TPA: MbcA/ParS/Xre antitoxin family protein [Sphingopyxis sp.]|nr:MbcA/ParS/Xre antitoxin family protein [Sphingopyxis sp.]HMP43519.1 MbcA/ParS/Xre antitoxin family protein [Sphingopyxis sp.]
MIANFWGLTGEQRRLILGYPARSTYYGWVKKAREHRDFTLSVNVLTRISAILGIHIGLRTLFDEDQEGVVWLRQPHDARVFGGAAPIDLITSGTQESLMTVRRFIDAARGGLYMAPSSNERDWPPYDDSEIIFVDTEG